MGIKVVADCDKCHKPAGDDIICEDCFDDVKDQLDELESDLEDIKEQNADLHGEIADLRKALSEAESRIADLEELLPLDVALNTIGDARD